MKLVLGLVVVCVLVTIGRAYPRLKGGYAQIPIWKTQVETDDLIKDPSYAPTPDENDNYDDEYDNYYEYGNYVDEYDHYPDAGTPDEETILEPSPEIPSEVPDDLGKDPSWEPSPEDYYEDYADEYDGYDYAGEPDDYVAIADGDDVIIDLTSSEEDDIWGSDEDPDYVSEEDDTSASDEDDPDYVPDYDNAVVDYEDYDSQEYDSQENDLYDDYDNSEEVLEDLLLQLAILKSEIEDPEGVQPDQTDVYLQLLQEQNLTLNQAEVLLAYAKSKIGSVDQDVAEPEAEDETEAIHQGPAKGAIKGKRQTKSIGAYVQQHQQHGQHQGGTSGDIGQGIEPLSGGSDISSSNHYGVSSGVEAIDEEEAVAEESSFLSWLGQGWGHVVDAADTVGDKISDAADTVQDVAGDVVDKVQDVASDVVDKVQDTASKAGDTIVSAYYKAKNEQFPVLRERIQSLFVNFGTAVQRGADYCIHHLGNAVDQVREAEILDKLRQKLAEGNEEVTAFFTLLGQKVTRWSQLQGQNNVDQGLIVVEGGGDLEAHISGNLHGQVPNLYQEQDIIEQMNQMVNSGILSQEELELLSQQQQNTEVDFLPNPYQQQSGASGIQVVSSVKRRRALRKHRGFKKH